MRAAGRERGERERDCFKGAGQSWVLMFCAAGGADKIALVAGEMS